VLLENKERSPVLGSTAASPSVFISLYLKCVTLTTHKKPAGAGRKDMKHKDSKIIIILKNKEDNIL